MMQQGMTRFKTGHRLQAPQHIGVYIAYVTENAITNPTLNKNQIKVRIPYFGNERGWAAATYTGRGTPPIGAECVVTFEGSFTNNPRVVSFNDWQSGPVIFSQASEPSAADQDLQPGDLWINP